ncbi:hypothetical protein C8J56DRAFT_1091442 [Mycena floridula]|nr:hypothetical protein C8J56DRAFT_1091442 [Mycena floridula]
MAPRPPTAAAIRRKQRPKTSAPHIATHVNIDTETRTATARHVLTTAPVNLRNSLKDDQNWADMNETPSKAEILASNIVDIPASPVERGMSSLLQPFLDIKDKIQSFYLSTHGDSRVNRPCPHCQTGAAALYRCVDCWLQASCCKACIVERHRLSPFHHLEYWNGTFFSRLLLRDINMTLYLGHSGQRCPHRNPEQVGRRLTVIHTNGVHKILVLLCMCQYAGSDTDQLFGVQLFPGTLTHPKTCFTFDVLNQFHIHTNESKKAAYDYHGALQRLTDNVFPDKVTDHYRIFQRVTRIHRVLAAERRAGRYHGMDALLPEWRKDSVAVDCPACPASQFNVELKTLANASPDERHKYTIFIDCDGTFNMPRIKKKDDPDDISLHAGRAIFVDSGPYKEYMKRQPQQPNQSTCNDLKMVKLQNLKKFKNCVTSGVIAVGCPRHGFFLRMADLENGEKYCSTDYVLREVLKRAGHRQRWRKLGYDIWCQYRVNLPERFRDEWPEDDELLEAIGKLTGLIGPVHIMGHIARCRALFLANTTRFAARTCMDNVEQKFAETKVTGRSTKQMNEGHCHEVLDDYHLFWNWKKMTDMGRSNAEKYQAAYIKLQQLEQLLSEFTATHSDTLIAEWTLLYNGTRPSPDERAPIDLFESRLAPAQLSLKARVKDVTDDEMVQILSSQSPDTARCTSTVLLDGVQLSLEMQDVAILSRTKDQDEATKEKIANQRKYLHPKVVSLTARLRQTFPALDAHLHTMNSDADIVDPNQPEQFQLPMPSRFSALVRAACDLTEAAVIEYKFHEGQAYDLLEDIRMNVLSWSINSRLRFDEIHGQYAATRSGTFLRSLIEEPRRLGHLYNCTRRSLLALGLPTTSQTFQELKVDSQLWIKDPSKPRRAGDTALEDPWYWRVAMPDNMSEAEREEWIPEMFRVKWFRDRADRDRWREEVETIEEEYSQTKIWHTKTAANWTTLATADTRPVRDPGHIAYAFKQAEMHRRLVQRSIDEWTKATKKVT